MDKAPFMIAAVTMNARKVFQISRGRILKTFRTASWTADWSLAANTVGSAKSDENSASFLRMFFRSGFSIKRLLGLES